MTELLEDRLYIEKIYLEKYMEDGWHRGMK